MATPEVVQMAEQAGFIFKGRVLREAPEQARRGGYGETSLTVEVEGVLRSTEALSHLTGAQVLIIRAGREDIDEGDSLLWFTNVVVLGAQVVLRELGHLKASAGNEREVEQALRAAEERMLQRHLAAANAVIHGRALSSHRAEEPSIMRSEHDPEWWIARVRVISTLKGKANGEIDVLFPNSTDIAWYKAPKLHEGMEGILVLWRGKVTEGLPDRGRNIYQVTEELDFIPLERLSEVQRLLGTEEEDR
jgi:hypothetical protein